MTMRLNRWLASLTLAAACAFAQAATLHVADTGLDANDGLSWGTAKRTVTGAVAAAVAGGHETVLVSNGTYQSATVNLTNGPLTLVSLNGAAVTFLRKITGNQNTVYLNHPDVVLDGFTIHAGQAGDGGGIRINDGIVQNCIIRNNNGIYRGGGVYMSGGLLTNCLVHDNAILYSSSTYGGGGVYMSGGLAVDCVISNNTASGNAGGGLRMLGGTVDRCLIRDNRGNGGGARIENAAAAIRNSMIVRNTSTAAGGGVVMTAGLIENCTLAANTAPGLGGGVSMSGGTVSNSIVYHNIGATFATHNLSRSGGTVAYSCITPAPPGDTNTDRDPEFTSRDTDDYALLPGSPGLDAGSNAAWMAGATDFAGAARIINGVVDIGGLEGDLSDGPFRCNFTADQTVGETSLTVVLTAHVGGSNTESVVYGWDFGNGTAHGADRAVVTNVYGPGIYSVSLSVTNAALESDFVHRSGYIKVGPLDFHVSAAGSHTAPFSNWATAATNLHEVFAFTAARDRIFIAGGDYPLSEPINWIRSGVTVLGGFEGTGAPGARDANRWPTVLRRDPSVSYMRVMNIVGVTNGLLDGLVLKDGFSNRMGAIMPGTGLYVESCSNLTLAACQFLDNAACFPLAAAGLYALNSYGVISNCVIARNNVDATGYNDNIPGAGANLTGGAWSVLDSVFAANGQIHQNHPGSQNLRGAGLHITSGDHLLRNCAIYGNGGGYRHVNYGAGLYVLNGTVRADHCTILGNRAEGVRRAGGSLILTNCVVWSNTVDIVGNVGLAACNIGDGTSNGVNGCFSLDPLFERGLYLAAGSPCRDTGAGVAADYGLAAYTTSTSGAPVAGQSDIGFHYPAGAAPDLETLYVSPAGDDANTGLASNQALRTLTRALGRARDGARIQVAAGLYNTAGGETFPLHLNRPGIALLGEGPDATIIDAAGANAQAVLAGGTPVGARLESLSVQGATASGVHINGAGVVAVQAELLLADCRVFSNRFIVSGIGYTDTQHGAGIGARYATLTLTNCLVVSNRNDATYYTAAEYGAGIGAYYSHLRLFDSVLLLNSNHLSNTGYHTVTTHGGGLFLLGGSGEIRNVLITKNRSRGTAAARNEWGAGVYVTGTTAVVFRNVTLADNGVGDLLPEGVSVADGAAVEIRNSILWNNGDDVTGTVTLAWCNIEDGDNLGNSGCISVDPDFVDAHHYHLHSKAGYYTNGFFSGGTWVRGDHYSPCIDAGEPAADFNREPVPRGGRVNLGAYGNSSVASKSPSHGTLLLVR